MKTWLLIASAAFVGPVLLVFLIAAIGHLKGWLRERRNNRETAKAAMDQWQYGQGFLTIDANGKVEHIPLHAIYNDDSAEGGR